MDEPALYLRGVGVTKGRTRILHGISARIGSGQLVAVIGPNGAGKSTLLAAIAGHLRFDGQILWDGHPVRHGLAGYLPQSGEIHASLSVLEAVLLGRFDRLGWRVRDADMAAALAALEALDLSPLAARPLVTLSGGQRQLVLLAQRLVREPRLLVLDEATSALDLHHQMIVLGHLKNYVTRTGALVLMAIHDLNLVARHAGDVLLLAGGGLAAFGPRQTVLTVDRLRESFGIEAAILQSDDAHPVIVPLAVAALSTVAPTL